MTVLATPAAFSPSPLFGDDGMINCETELKLGVGVALLLVTSLLVLSISVGA